MHLCGSTYLAIDGQLATCVKTEAHAGRHFSVDGEMWGDDEQFVAKEAPQDAASAASSGGWGAATSSGSENGGRSESSGSRYFSRT